MWPVILTIYILGFIGNWIWWIRKLRGMAGPGEEKEAQSALLRNFEMPLITGLFWPWYLVCVGAYIGIIKPVCKLFWKRNWDK